MKSTNHRTPENAQLARDVARRRGQVVLQTILLGAILFVTSGRLDWVWAWAYLGAGVAILVVNLLVMDPELVAERGRVKEDTKPWDRRIAAAIGIFVLAMLILAGLDERWAWSPELSTGIHLSGLAVSTLGQLIFSWAMASNPFFSCSVRIQTDRGQRVAAGGPYRFVRHPGYAGMTLSLLAVPVLLGSLWALIPAGLAVLGYIIRTALEDRTLKEELEGYRDFAEQTRYRLLPGIW